MKARKLCLQSARDLLLALGEGRDVQIPQTQGLKTCLSLYLSLCLCVWERGECSQSVCLQSTLSLRCSLSICNLLLALDDERVIHRPRMQRFVRECLKCFCKRVQVMRVDNSRDQKGRQAVRCCGDKMSRQSSTSATLEMERADTLCVV